MMISKEKLSEILAKYKVDQMLVYKMRRIHEDCLNDRFDSDYFVGFVNGLWFSGALDAVVVNDIAVSMVLGE